MELLAAITIVVGAASTYLGVRRRRSLVRVGLLVILLGGVAAYGARLGNVLISMIHRLPRTLDEWDFLAFATSQSLECLLCALLALAALRTWSRASAGTG